MMAGHQDRLESWPLDGRQLTAENPLIHGHALKVDGGQSEEGLATDPGTRRVKLIYPEPDLGDGVLRLRRWEYGDVECVRLAATDRRIPSGTSVPSLFSPEEGRAYIERQWSRQVNGEGLSLAIAEQTSGDAVGFIGAFFRPQSHVVGLGYWIVPPARGRGYSRRAIALLAPWLLTETNTTRVEALVEPENVPSRRCLEQSGFKEEGVLRGYLGGERDAVMFSLVQADLKAVQQ